MRVQGWVALMIAVVIIALSIPMSFLVAQWLLLSSHVSTGITSTPSGMTLYTGNGKNELTFLDCNDGELEKYNGTSLQWECATDSTVAVTGAGVVALDLGSDGQDSAAITEIDTVGDTNSIFTEPSPDVLNINLGQNWPSADGVTCTGCIGTTEAAGLDISDDTNLTCGRSLTASGDGCDADAELYTDTKGIYIEDPTAADDLTTIWTAIGLNYTITSITCESDQTVVFDLQIDDGTPAAVNGSDITCTTYATDSSLAGDTGLDDGERLDLSITSVSGTPTWVAIFWTYTKND